MSPARCAPITMRARSSSRSLRGVVRFLRVEIPEGGAQEVVDALERDEFVRSVVLLSGG